MFDILVEICYNCIEISRKTTKINKKGEKMKEENKEVKVDKFIECLINDRVLVGLSDFDIETISEVLISLRIPFRVGRFLYEVDKDLNKKEF